MTDTERLNWLQAKLNEGRYSGSVVFRWSDAGRGWRLHETRRTGGSSKVRVAIDKAMAEERSTA